MSSATDIEKPVIEVSHVATKFGQAVVHEDISLSIRRGEIFAIAGGNGCGKTTLLREIIGLMRPDAGTIRLDEWKAASTRPLFSASARAATT